MIPATISATLSSHLIYNPSVHIQTVEIDRTGSELITEVSSNYIRWYLDKNDFADMIRIVPGQVDVSNQIFTMDASQGRYIPDASECMIQFSRITKTYTIPLHNPTINYGLDIDLDNSSNIGYVGSLPVEYDRELYTSDLSNATASATSTTWGFAQSSISMTIHWEATDLSNVISVTADAGSTLTVMKPYNEAAVDFIQIRLNNEAYGNHNRTSTSEDILTNSVDFASHFRELTGNLINFSSDIPKITISDLVFTKALQQAINRDTISRPVRNTNELRDVVKLMIELRELTGFQSMTGLTNVFPTTIAGISQSANDMSFNVIPMIYFRYRPPSRFSLVHNDPAYAPPYRRDYLHVALNDSNGNVDAVENKERRNVTANIKLRDATDISSTSYQIVPINYDLSNNTFVYKLDFSGHHFSFSDISSMTVNNAAFRVGREITPSMTQTDISHVYRVQHALTSPIQLHVDASAAELSVATQTSTRGIMTFKSGYDVRITDQYLNATPGDHRVCLCKTTGENEIIKIAGITSISGGELNRYIINNDPSHNAFDVWVDGVKQWNRDSTTDISYIADLSGIVRLGTTPSNADISGYMQCFRAFDQSLTPKQIGNPNLQPPPSIEWTMNTPHPERGILTVSGPLHFIASQPTPMKPPLLVSAAPHTVVNSIASRAYTFDRDFVHYALDASYSYSDSNSDSYTTKDISGTGSTDMSINNNVVTISFPIDPSLSYTCNNFQMRNLGSQTVIPLNDASYSFSTA